MSKQPQYTWNDDKFVDDVEFNQDDAAAFQSLLQNAKQPDGAPTSMLPSGTILKGRIVEFTKDHVVIDVGLKSEGLVPIAEFSDPSELVLDGEVEVFLDEAEEPVARLCSLARKQSACASGNTSSSTVKKGPS